MKKLNIVVVIMFLVLGLAGCKSVLSGEKAISTDVFLFDFSGSLSSCGSLMKSNLEDVNRAIDNLGKNDRFYLFGYKSKGKPVLLAGTHLLDNQRMPETRGPKDVNLIKARNHLRKQLSSSIDSIDSLMGSSGSDTDIIGALNYALLFVGDLARTGENVRLVHYSDGIHTSGAGSFEITEYRKYLARLDKRLSRAVLVKPVIVTDISWKGAMCAESMDTVTNDVNFLQSELRNMWVTFLAKEAPGVPVDYRLSY